MTLTTNRIRALNDELRRKLPEGRAVMTTGVAALGAEAVARIVKTIAVYDDFCHANDPHEEHDFGSFEAGGAVIFFKIDYYDDDLTYHSPDPSDPSVTERVITIMLAEEYYPTASNRDKIEAFEHDASESPPIYCINSCHASLRRC
jgi:Protein of unknown function (DUF3768)